MAALQSYRRRVASMYRSLKPEEITTGAFGGPFHVSPKVDGELWFLVLEPERGRSGQQPTARHRGGRAAADRSPRGRAQKSARVVIAGELFAVSSGKGRPRVGDVAICTGRRCQGAGGAAGVHGLRPRRGRAGRCADVVPVPAAARCAVRTVGLGKRAKAVRTDTVGIRRGPACPVSELVEGGKAEGLVVRSAQGTIYKIKPEFTIDAAVLGYTVRTEDADAVRTLLLGLTREDGRIQIAGHCGNLGSDEDRRTLLKRLTALQMRSSFRCPSRSGDLFTFVKPEIVVEINVTDLQARNQRRPSRPDDGARLRAEQRLEGDQHRCPPRAGCIRCSCGCAKTRSPARWTPASRRSSSGAWSKRRCQAPRRVQLPPSEVVRRKVWTKTPRARSRSASWSLWKTNKSDTRSQLPGLRRALDRLLGRARTPLDREVRTAPTDELMEEIVARFIEENIKKGWEEIA